ncbi:hypothetical protein [Streptomyces sp. NPDC051211]|uniref:hypothetical protein n=1 Tax=Streptomyces sp. NPDC051211 TaxID=3154643 RepID=UPI00344D1595
MNDYAILAILATSAGGVGWLLRRKHLERVAAGPVGGIPCMVRSPAGQGRWRAGRVGGDAGGLWWEPARRAVVPLPGLAYTEVRAPSVREGMAINPGSRIVRCEGDGGSIEIAVMALHLAELLKELPQKLHDEND